jgi:pimeloyl-ACP methyl ester carboxylesterase
MDITIDGRHLSCQVEGEGPPALFIHGFPLSGRLWRPVVRGLRDRYRCIVPDLRGHGGSEATSSATMADYAADLARLLDALGEKQPVVLVGMSMGGYVAFEFCRRLPARVRALVLTNTRAQEDTAEAAQVRRETAQRVQKEGSALVADAMVDKLFGSSAPDALKEDWRRLMKATPPAGVAAALKAMASRPDSFDTLAGLECPILIVAGEEDAITPPADAERMHHAAPGSRLAIVPGAGHMTPVEKPDEFLATVRTFLQESAAP